jgi:diadenosine tetraphosphate (Ap4A) HIT family hydrolase
MDPRCTEACREIFLPRDYYIAELSVSVAALCPDQAVRGRCLVTLREHVTELFQLTPAMRTAFLEVVARVAEALFRTLAPVKINSALLGNVVPHMHWHVNPRGWPRTREDGVYPRPIWVVDRPRLLLPAGERDELIAAIRSHLR